VAHRSTWLEIASFERVVSEKKLKNISYSDQRISNDSHVCLPDQMEMTNLCRGPLIYNFYEARHYLDLDFI
jgi:hypothetical protein